MNPSEWYLVRILNNDNCVENEQLSGISADYALTRSGDKRDIRWASVQPIKQQIRADIV